MERNQQWTVAGPAAMPGCVALLPATVPLPDVGGSWESAAAGVGARGVPAAGARVSESTHFIFSHTKDGENHYAVARDVRTGVVGV